MPIMRFEPTASPIDRIAKAVEVARGIYGIRADSAKIDQLKQQNDIASQDAENRQTVFDQGQAATARSLDPNSQESKLIKADAQSYLGSLANSELGKKNPQAFKPLQDLAADPQTSGAALQAAFEKSPLLKHVSTLAAKDEGIKYLATALANRNANTQEKTDLNANGKYTNELKPYEATIQSANRADNIINDIKNGGLKSTKLLSTDLSAALGSMFNNGKGATVYSMGHAEVNTAYGTINNFVQKYSGKPMNTIPPEMLDQVQKDVQALRDSYSQAHEAAYASFREGLPERVQPALDNRFNKFREKSGLQKIDLAAEGKATGGSGLPGVGTANASDAPAKTYDKDVLDYANQHGISPEKANSIKLQRTGGKN